MVIILLMADNAISTVRNLPKLPKCDDKTKWMMGPGDGFEAMASRHAGTVSADVANAAPSIMIGGAENINATNTATNSSHEDRSRW